MKQTTAKSETNKEYIKKEPRKLFRSMDFVSNNFLADEKAAGKDFQMYFNIYQQLGLAWEYLGQQCKHWDGYKKTREKHEVCRICGKVKVVSCQELFTALSNSAPRLCVISDAGVQDTDATQRYRYHAEGWPVGSRSTSGSETRSCVTTRTDGTIEIEVVPNQTGAYLRVTTD